MRALATSSTDPSCSTSTRLDTLSVDRDPAGFTSLNAGGTFIMRALSLSPDSERERSQINVNVNKITSTSVYSGQRRGHKKHFNLMSSALQDLFLNILV